MCGNELINSDLEVLNTTIGNILSLKFDLIEFSASTNGPSDMGRYCYLGEYLKHEINQKSISQSNIVAIIPNGAVRTDDNGNGAVIVPYASHSLLTNIGYCLNSPTKEDYTYYCSFFVISKK